MLLLQCVEPARAREAGRKAGGLRGKGEADAARLGSVRGRGEALRATAAAAHTRVDKAKEEEREGVELRGHVSRRSSGSSVRLVGSCAPSKLRVARRPRRGLLPARALVSCSTAVATRRVELRQVGRVDVDIHVDAAVDDEREDAVVERREADGDVEEALRIADARSDGETLVRKAFGQRASESRSRHRSRSDEKGERTVQEQALRLDDDGRSRARRGGGRPGRTRARQNEVPCEGAEDGERKDSVRGD